MCRYVLISYGHNALSSDSMMKMLGDLSGDDTVFGHFGATGGYALAARRAMHEFGTGPETWKKIAVGQRKWANLNPKAMMVDKPMTEADRCPQCLGTGTGDLISKGVGRVYTFAVYHTAFHPGFKSDLPYTVAVVALDEGPRLLSNIVGCPPDRVTCNMPVEVVWEDVDERVTLPKFRPLA